MSDVRRGVILKPDAKVSLDFQDFSCNCHSRAASNASVTHARGYVYVAAMSSKRSLGYREFTIGCYVV